MSPDIAVILGVIAALTCTILAFIFIVPEKRRAQLPKFWKAIHDLFNFKYLVLEAVLKFMYVLATLSCIGIGFFLLFSGYSYGYGFYGGGGFQSLALEGLIVMIAGPILVRLSYEMMMMFIILVKNTIQINKKLSKDGKQEDGPSFDIPVNEFRPAAPVAPAAPVEYTAPVEPAAPAAPVEYAAPAAPVAPAAPAEEMFCPYCGTKQSSENFFCINCQRRLR